MDLSKVVFNRDRATNQQKEQNVSGTNQSRVDISQQLQRIEENPKEGQSVDTPINENNENEELRERKKISNKAVMQSMEVPDLLDDMCNCSFSDEVGDNYFDMLSDDEGKNDGKG